MKGLEKLLASMSDDDDEALSKRVFAKPDDLKKLSESYFEQNNFAVGDIVCWKKGLKNKKLPAYGEPGIVMGVISPPIMASEPSEGSAYFREKLDIAIGVVDGDDDFVIFHFDSNRFTKFEKLRSSRKSKP